MTKIVNSDRWFVGVGEEDCVAVAVDGCGIGGWAGFGVRS